MTTTEERPVWRSRIVGHGEEDPARLTPNPQNWRKHPRRQRAALAPDALDRVVQLLHRLGAAALVRMPRARAR